ncbi:MAG: PadR family transcriptional regulator [Planctomycetota bacterium]
MALRNVLLGFLERPASGYDIKQAFEQSLSHLWAAETSQIYGTLRTLERDGLLLSTTEKSSKGPARRVYSRTAEGDEAFAAWLDEDPELSRERLSVLAQLHFLGRARDPIETAAFLERVRERFVERLAEYEASREVESSHGASGDSLLQGLALDLGLKTMQARIEWCDDAIERLKGLKGTRPDSAGA